MILLGGFALLAYTFDLFAPPPAHIAALVPQDAPFTVVSRSINDLRDLYTAEFEVTEFDAARELFGNAINVPALDGVEYDKPLAYYVDPSGGLVYLVPFTDLGALESAHAVERGNINAKRPVRVARDYVSISESDTVATVGPDNELVLEAAQYPLALVGRPTTPAMLRYMLVALFGAARQTPTRISQPLALLCERLPTVVAEPAVREMDTLRLAILPHRPNDPAVRFDLVAQPGPESLLARAAPLAGSRRDKKLDPAALLGTLPGGDKMNSVLGAAVVLDGEGWRTMGLPLNPGAAAGMFAIVALKYRAGRHNLVFALAPSETKRFEQFDVAPLFGLKKSDANSVKLTDGTMAVYKLAGPPAAFAHILKSDARTPPPTFLCTGQANGFWYCTIGAHAEEVMRALIDAATGERPLIMRDLKAMVDKKTVPTAAHAEFWRHGRVALGFLTAEAPRAMKFAFPYIQTASITNPEAFTCIVEMDRGRLHADIRVFRAERK